MKRWAAALLCAALAACTTPVFQSDIARGPTPWTKTTFDNAPEDFSFAVVSDLESGYRPGVFDVAVAELNLLRPNFVLTIGDMIDGGTEDEAELQRQWTSFDAMVDRLHAPYFHIAGNHDMTNLTQRKVWEERYGRRFYHFIYGNVLFLALDTEDYPPTKMKQIFEQRAEFLEARKNDPLAAEKLPYRSLKESRTGEIGPEQSAYFEKVIADHPEVRWTILLFHKPVYERTDGLGLSRIEAALKGRPYTVLNSRRRKARLHHAGHNRRRTRLRRLGRRGRSHHVVAYGQGRSVHREHPARRRVRQDGRHPCRRRETLPRSWRSQLSARKAAPLARGDTVRYPSERRRPEKRPC
jgi:hypothetical protein